MHVRKIRQEYVAMRTTDLLLCIVCCVYDFISLIRFSVRLDVHVCISTDIT